MFAGLFEGEGFVDDFLVELGDLLGYVLEVFGFEEVVGGFEVGELLQGGDEVFEVLEL